MMWISVENGMKPYRHKIYNVIIQLANGNRVNDFGYWNGEDWEPVQEVSEYQNLDYVIDVIYWIDDSVLPEPPKCVKESE
jgi:hypothetical protein